MALTRKFNSKVYHFHAQFRAFTSGKLRANALASKIRKAGGLARITTENGDLKRIYIVWSRNK